MWVEPQFVASAVEQGIKTIACELRPDVYAALKEAQERETSVRGRRVLRMLIDNADIAKEQGVPLCQDTGTVWVRLEAGPDCHIPGDVFSLVDEAVERAYKACSLRMSVVRDALLDRENTGTNAPAFCDVAFSDKPGVHVSIMLKGGGSDNASRVVMLPPGAGREGVEQEVLRCVREKAANACPPLVIGVGVGSTFDHVGALAKTALLWNVDASGDSPDAEVRDFEQRLLRLVNETGIGPAALGGDTTALAVRVNTAPCHIAALPLAINLGCCAMRAGTFGYATEGER